MKKQNIEVEGGELLIMSKEGHYAVIPAKHRQEVMDMVKDGCDNCINDYIQTLPKDSDYAQDGTVFSNPPKKVKVQHPDGTIKQYNTTDKEYRQVYNTAKSWYYDKNTDTYGYSNLPEVTVTAKKNTSINNNILKDVTPNMNLQEYYNNQSVNKTDAISNLGNKQQVDAKIFRNQQYQDLENLDDNDFRDKYQTSKHRFKYDNDETYKKQIDENAKILTKQSGSIDYPNTDIRSKSYTGNPNLAFMNPNGLTGKSAVDNEQFHMDLIGSVLPIPGINQMGKIKGLENVIDKGNKALKGLDEVDNIIKKLPKLEKYTGVDYLEKIKTDKLNNLIRKEGNIYIKNLSDSKTIDRAINLDKEYGTRLEQRIKDYSNNWYDNEMIGYNKKIQIGEVPDNAIGVNRPKTFQELDNLEQQEFMLNKNLKTNEFTKEYEDKFKPNTISTKNDLRISKVLPRINEGDIKNVVRHELSHDVNYGGIFFDESPKLNNDIKSIFKDFNDVDINEAKNSIENTVMFKTKSPKKNLSKADIQEEYEYITKPTETQAFLFTNMRDDLIEQGLLKDSWDILTIDKLDKLQNSAYNRFSPFIKDKKQLVNMFNKMLPVLTIPLILTNNKQK